MPNPENSLGVWHKSSLGFREGGNQINAKRGKGGSTLDNFEDFNLLKIPFLNLSLRRLTILENILVLTV